MTSAAFHHMAGVENGVFALPITLSSSSVVCRKAGLSTGLTLQGTVHPELAHSGELVR